MLELHTLIELILVYIDRALHLQTKLRGCSAIAAHSVVAKQIALSTEGYRLLAQDIVSKASFAHTVSTSWIRDMLKSQGFTVKKPALVGRRLWADDEKAAISHRLALKMLWTMNTYKIPPTRVYNIDETAISLTPGISLRSLLGGG